MSAPTVQGRPQVRDEDLEQHRRELTGYCYRMLGSAFEAEDAVQETMVRAWRALDRFEGRSSLRSWLYRIATNVCLDMLHGRASAGPGRWTCRRRRPAAGRRRSGTPLPRDDVGRADARRPRPARRRRPGRASRSPASRSAWRSSPRCSTCPPRQRAVLILREVLRWKADEVAELLDTTVASVNSALQRARATLDGRQPTPATRRDAAATPSTRRCWPATSTPSSATTSTRSSRCCTRTRRMSMPPFALWLSGPRRHRRVAPRAGQSGAAGSKLARAAGQRHARATRSTSRAARAASCRGRSTCSRSPTAGSARSRTSSVRGCSPRSGCPSASRPEGCDAPGPSDQ